MPSSDKKHKTPRTRGKSLKAVSENEMPKKILADRNRQPPEAWPDADNAAALPDARAREREEASDKVTKRRSVKALKGMFGKARRAVSLEEMDATIRKHIASEFRAPSTKEDSQDSSDET